MISLAHKLLEIPALFELQQKVCNNYATTKKQFSKYLTIPNTNILDIGCSTGTCANSIIDFEQVNYNGIDIDQNYIDRAHQKYPKAHFHCMDARSLSFSPNSIDLVMFIGVLHHLSDQVISDCLDSIINVLKPDGHIIVAEPLFTPGKPISNFFLSHDRGDFIREESKYKKLFEGKFTLKESDYYPFSIHRFCALTYQKAM